MTAKIKALVVVLTEDLDADDPLLLGMVQGIMCMRKVAIVTQRPVEDSDHLNRERLRHEFSERLLDVIYPRKA